MVEFIQLSLHGLFTQFPWLFLLFFVFTAALPFIESARFNFPEDSHQLNKSILAQSPRLFLSTIPVSSVLGLMLFANDFPEQNLFVSIIVAVGGSIFLYASFVFGISLYYHRYYIGNSK